MPDEHTLPLRQYAQTFITGSSREVPGPAFGYALLRLIAHVDEGFKAVWAQMAQTEQDLDDVEDRYEAQFEQQRTIIEALIEENDALRAKLYVQEKKPAD